MKLVSLKCESCGAISEITVDEDKTIVFCAHCGMKNLLDDGTKKIFHHIKKEDVDVARITESENLVRLKELEIAQHKKKMELDEAKTEMRIGLVVFAIIGILLLAGIIFGIGEISNCMNAAQV